MRITQMLNDVAGLHVSKSSRRTNSDKAIAGQKATMRARRNDRWRKAFSEFNGVATSEDLACALGRTSSSVNCQLIRMRKESPPAVAVVGKLPSGSNNPRLIYRWVLD